MATFNQAVQAKESAFDRLYDVLHVRPGAVGVISVGTDDYGLKVVLPQEPPVTPPVTLSGVPVHYFIEVEPARLMGGYVSKWRSESLRRRK